MIIDLIDANIYLVFLFDVFCIVEIIDWETFGLPLKD